MNFSLHCEVSRYKGVRFRVSGVSKQMTACDEPFGRESLHPELATEGLRAERLSRVEDRKQKPDRVLHFPGFTIYLLSSDF